MKIAIQHSIGHKEQYSFVPRWIQYCQENDIAYKMVDAYKSDIIRDLKDCNIFMWHFSQMDYRDMLFARQLLYSVTKMGLRVFPDFDTAWHFDDKVGQKYLLEAVNAPFVPSYTFYIKEEALEWANNTTFPKVFKLRGGAGSSNVYLVKTKSDAVRRIKKAFGRGFSQRSAWRYAKEQMRTFQNKNGNYLNLLKAVAIWLLPAKYIHAKQFSKMHGKEIGYVYFQDFIPNNLFDIRIVVTGDKAFGIKRMTRKNDFRASGGGNIVYAKEEIDQRCVKIAFDVNDKINAQSIGYDFVFDGDNNPLIIEINYAYSPSGYDACEGYWDKKMNWHEGKFNPYGWMIEELIYK